MKSSQAAWRLAVDLDVQADQQRACFAEENEVLGIVRNSSFRGGPGGFGNPG
jgi:hypothetical protein